MSDSLGRLHYGGLRHSNKENMYFSSFHMPVKVGKAITNTCHCTLIDCIYCFFPCLFTSWLMCTDCRLLMWPDWILLAACNTDLCRWVKPQCQMELWVIYHVFKRMLFEFISGYYLLAGLHWLDHMSRNTWGRRAGVWQAVVGVNRALYGWKTGFIRYLNRIEGKAQTLLPQS